MEAKDRMKFYRQRYSFMDSLIITIYYLTITAALIIGIQLFVLSLGLQFRTLIDFPILQSYITKDFYFLFGVSIFTLLGGSFGLLSAAQLSYTGVITSMAILLLTISITDIYSLSNYRTTNYISKANLFNVLFNAITNNSTDNFPIHYMQIRLSCCGINDYTDWLYTLGVIPGSCCNNSTICDIDDPSLNTNGCLKELEAIFRHNYGNTVDVIVGLNFVGVVALLTGFFVSYLIQELRKGDNNPRIIIPRIPTYHNNARYQQQQTEQIPNLYNNRASVPVISDNSVATASPIYPNLYCSESDPNLPRDYIKYH